MVVTCLADDGTRVAYRVPRGCGRSSCLDVELSVARTTIRALFEGAPLSRIDAIGELSEVQRYRLFPPKCQCGSDHGKYARNLLRCYRGLSAPARKAGEEIELSLTEWIRLAAVQGITAEETGRLQILQVAQFAFGGSPPESPPADSCDSGEVSAGETAA